MSGPIELRKHGDTRTRLATYRPGAYATYVGTDKATYVVTSRCTVPVTDEWNAYSQCWEVKVIDWQKAIELAEAPRPTPWWRRLLRLLRLSSRPVPALPEARVL